MPRPPAPPRTRASWRPTALTWLGGAGLLLILIIAAASGGFGGFLIMLGLAVLVTAIYAVVTRRPSWMNLPRSRPVAGIGAAGALVVIVLGSSLYGLGHPSPVATHVTAEPTSHSAGASGAVHLLDVVGTDGSDAKTALAATGLHVTIKTSDGREAPSDLTGWTVRSEYPEAGSNVGSKTDVVLTLAPPATPSPRATAASTPSLTPVATVAPKLVAPVVPAPAAPAPAPAPVAPQPAPPPAPAPAPPAAGTIIPGAFCPDAQVGQSGLAANGRTYVCGGKGPDANGHYHWNS